MAITRDQSRNRSEIFHIFKESIIGSIKQLNPLVMIKNPIMFIAEILFMVMVILSIKPDLFGITSLTRETNIIISTLILFTILSANFIENLARQIGKSQVESLKIIHGDIEVKKILPNGEIEYVFTSQLKKGDIIKVQEGDLIPLDGEVIEGVATIDESAITGESSPVLKDSGIDISRSVTGGTRVLTDWLLIKIISEQGQTYLDQMINLVEDTERHKTPNEIKLNTLLRITTMSFLLTVISFLLLVNYLNIKLEPAYLIALVACLIPTTTSGLLKSIGISGFNKFNSLNILAISRDAIEITGNINILFIDKTGTLTFGNRIAIELIPLGNNSLIEVAKLAFLTSYFDGTVEGRSIISLIKRYITEMDIKEIKGTTHEFSASTRMSGIDLENGEILRKGAPDAIKKFILKRNGKLLENTEQLVENIAIQGGTPLLLSKNNEVTGIIHLKDMVKPNIKDKFQEIKNWGIKTIMCTGDNNLTAKVIAKEAGIDNYIAQAKPEGKIQMIRDYQSQGMIVAMIGDGTNDAPALAQADIGICMNNGTVAAKEASNMIDLESDPTKIINVIKTGIQQLTTKKALTTFSIITDISKYFLILPSIFISLLPINIMHLHLGLTSIFSVLIFNAMIILLMTPLALRGIKLRNNLLLFGFLGLIIPLFAIKIINIILGGLVK
ncbi:MAG: potassium-transporting ATPase subunit KdpB [Candidatus Melainabacteria bacterium]|nr:potassium-transporting ATPase subunit KdpB [Candidatus Melainabacteria bacterium]